MAKAPAFQFFPGDARRDAELHMMSFEARGIWWEMLCCMWDAKERGMLEGTREQLCRLIGCTQEELSRSLKEISVTKTGDVTECNDLVTVINRRMHRDERERKLTRSRVKKHRGKEEKRECNDDVTGASSSSSSSSFSSLENIQYGEESTSAVDDKSSPGRRSVKIVYNFNTRSWENITLEQLDFWSKTYPALNIQAQLARIAAWLDANPTNRKSNYARFINGWLSRDQDRAPRNDSAPRAQQATDLLDAARRCYARNGSCQSSWSMFREKPGDACHWCQKFANQREKNNT